MKTVSLDGLRKTYPNGHEAVRGVSLEVGEGEFVVLVGPSGCGKTTVLRMVAGLEEITAGELRVGGRVVTHANPSARDMAMVFQNYALYPHMTVSENIGFSLKLKGVGKAERRRKVEEAARILGLDGTLDKKPGQLSGGQRQRVAMGRAIVREPAAFLMDEPLSNLDAKLRVGMRAEVSRIQRRLGVATLYVTHDQVEAMTMGDRVAVMRDGVVEQCAPPQELYDQPTNLFVAGFVGSPSMNFFTAVVREDCSALRIGDQDLALRERDMAAHPAIKQYAGRQVVLGLRPEHFDLEVQNGQPVLSGQVDLVEGLGSELLVHLRVDPRSEVAAMPDEEGEGEPRERGEVIVRVDARTIVRAGQQLTLGIDTERMHLFDPVSGSSINSRAGSRPPGETNGSSVREKAQL